MTDLLQQTVEALRKTKKGQLNYDPYWYRDENSREFLNLLDHRCLRIAPLPPSPLSPKNGADITLTSPPPTEKKKVLAEENAQSIPDFHFYHQYAEKEMEILRCKTEAKKQAQREFYKKVDEFWQFSQEQKKNYEQQMEAIKKQKLERLKKLYDDFKVDSEAPCLESTVDQEESVTKNVTEKMKDLEMKHRQERGERQQRKLYETQHLQAVSTLRDIQKGINDTTNSFVQYSQKGFELPPQLKEELQLLNGLKNSVAKLEAECVQPKANFSLLIPKLAFHLEQVKQLHQRVNMTIEVRLAQIRAIQQQQHQVEKKPPVDLRAQIHQRAQQTQEVPKSSSSSAPTPPPSSQPATISTARKEYFPNSYSEYERLKNLKKEFEKQFAVLLEPAHKKFKFELHKTTCQTVNSISDRVVGYCISRLRSLLSGNKVDTWTGMVISVKDHPAAIYLCKYLIAKTIVSQGEEQVTGQPQTAIPIAKVLLELWFNYPDLGDLTRAFFYERCPHLVPYLPRPRAGQSDEDYLQTVGYHVSTQGLPEKEDAFLKRMGGLATLYATILATEPLHQREHPFGLQHLWQWLQETVHLDPLPDITATVVIHVLEVAAPALHRTYHHQFMKLLHSVAKDYFPRIQAAASPECGGAPVKRLEDLLEKLLQISQPASTNRRFY